MPYVKRAEFDRLLLAGQMLSNIAFNLGQNESPESTELSERNRRSLRESQRAWDKARARIRNK
jgi:hypothetical protein